MNKYQNIIFIFFMILTFFSRAGSCVTAGVNVLWQKDLFNEEKTEHSSKGHTTLAVTVDRLVGRTCPDIVCVVNRYEESKIYLLSGSDGSVKWENCLGARTAYSLSVFQDRGEKTKTVLVGTYDGLISNFNLRTGELLKEIDHEDDVRVISCADLNNDGITDYAVVGDWLHMAVYDGKNAKKLWQFKSKDHMNLEGFVIDDINRDGLQEVIGTDQSNNIVVMDAFSGKLRWEKNLWETRVMGIFSGPNAACAYGTVNIYEKRVLIVGTAVGDLLFLDGKNGRKIKESKKMTGYPSSISLGDINSDGILDIVVSSIDHKVYGIDGKKLDEIWGFKTDDEVYSSPALGDMDNDGLLDVVVISDDDWVYCIDGENGKLIWKYDVGGDCQASNAFIADVNSNGFVDVVLEGALYGGKLTVLETDAGCNPGQIMWPKVFGNNRNTGEYGVR